MTTRPTDVGTLQAIAAVGQPRLMERLGAILGDHGLLAGQVLLTPHDFGVRSQYLHAREALRRLLDLGVVPVVNENDTVADDEIRYGDNDRLAALVAHLVAADLLVLLTDTAGLFTADPRVDADASLIEEIVEVDAALEALAGGRGTDAGERRHGHQAGGGQDRGVVGRAGGDRGRRRPRRARRRHRRARGRHRLPARDERLPSRKLWIAFAMNPAGRVRRRRRCPPRPCATDHRSLLPAGVRGVEGDLRRRRRGRDRRTRRRALREGPGQVLRRRCSGGSPAGRRRSSATALPHEVVHRDDLVVLPG